jgi:hypothetical protein
VGHAHAARLSVYRQSQEYEVVGIVEPDDRLREEAKSKESYRGLPWLTREQLLDVTGLRDVTSFPGTVFRAMPDRPVPKPVPC